MGSVFAMVFAVLLSWRSWVMIAVWDSSVDCNALICWVNCCIACGIWLISVLFACEFGFCGADCAWVSGGLDDVSGGCAG